MARWLSGQVAEWLVDVWLVDVWTEVGSVEEGRLVVAVALIDGDRRVLAARRVSPPALAGMWEFPGGKVEPGEDELAALRRECREELDVEIEVGRLFGEIALPRPGWRMRLWLGRVAAGEPFAAEHDDLRWLGVGELDDVPWLPADAPLVDALRAELAEPVEGSVGS